MTEEARKIVETIKEAFEALAAMELPAEEQWCEINRDNAMTLIAELEQVPEQEKVVKEFDYTLEVAEELQKDFESHAGSVDYLCSQVRHAVNIIKRLSAQLEQVTRERDAAICDINMLCQCDVCTRMCKYDKPNPYCECADFEWRGVEVEG